MSHDHTSSLPPLALKTRATVCKEPSENALPGFIWSSRQLGSEHVRGARGENLNEIKWEAKWGKPYVRPPAGLQRSENFLAPSPLLTALNLSIACGHLESQSGSLQGLGWLLRRSYRTHFLAFVAVGDTCFLCRLSPLLGPGGAVRKSQADGVLPGNLGAQKHN